MPVRSRGWSLVRHITRITIVNRQIMTYDVIVIGCGAAGVAALRKLHDAGVKVIGLEAADRIGGRIQTVKFGESAIDLGATWCVGEKNNPVFELVKSLDLLDPSYYSNWFLRTNGELVDASKGNAILEALGDEIAKADKNTTISIAEFVRSRLNTNEILKKDAVVSKSLIEYYERLNRIGADGDLRNSESLKATGEYQTCEGRMMNWRGRGYTTILDVLLNKYPDPSKMLPIDIQLNKEVENIDWSSENALQVKCKDGTVYTAKSVIVTVSVAVLKERHAQLFNPPLPSSKVNTIRDLQLCQIGKIYVEFTEPWWPETPISIKILWTDEDKAKFIGDDKWLTEIYSLDSVAAQPNSLLIWVYGGGVADMEKLSEEQVEVGLNKLLDLVVKKQFNVTPIKTFRRTQWTKDPLTGCAYAYRSVATEENQSGGAVELSEPLYNGGLPVVCFAGEATSHHWHHDAHGAVESGFREAQRLIEVL